MPDAKSSLTLLGRDKSLATIRKAMDRAVSSKGSFVLISGEAGIGKTAVISKISEEAKSKGWVIMSSECFPGKGGDPYLPFISALKDYLETMERSSSRHRGHGSAPATLPASLMGVATQDDLAEERRSIKELKSDRERMFENVLDLIKEASKGAPVLFSIDDLHWAEVSTLHLLYYIIRSTVSDKVLVVGAYRKEELENPRIRHPLVDVVQRVRQEGMLVTVELDRLNEHDTSRLVKALCSTAVSDELIKKIHHETGGNPFFIKEFMKELEGKCNVDLSSITIPSSVSLLIKNRLKGLDKVQQEVLQDCAILGQQFNYDLLSGVSTVDESELVNALDGLIGFKILEEKARGSNINYAFTHSLLREVTYDGLSTAKRRILHTRAGEHLEKLFAGRVEQAAYQLAYHFSKTSVLSKAFKYTAMAGLVSYQHMALEEARQNLEDALDLLQKLEPDASHEAQEAELMSTLGCTYNSLGHTHKALECHMNALDLTGEQTPERAMALRNIAEVQIECSLFKESLDTLKTALDISRKLSDTKGLAESYRDLLWVAVELGDHESALKYAELGIKEAKKAKDRHLEGKILIDLGNAYNIRSDSDKALYYYEEALKVLDHNTHLDQLSRVYNNIGDLLMKLKKYDRALENFENSIEIARVSGDHRRKTYGEVNLAFCTGLMGKFDQSIPMLEKTLKQFEWTEDSYGIAVTILSIGIIQRNAGKYSAAEEYFKKAISLTEEKDLEIVNCYALMEYGLSLKRWGKKDAALKVLDKLLKSKENLDKKTKIGGIDEGLKELMELKTT
jgi:tetratricopeptide (TPR) repeat protein